MSNFFDRFTTTKDTHIEVPILPKTDDNPEFVVRVSVLPQKEINEQVRRCSKNNELDFDKYAAFWGRRILVGWDGLTMGNLRQLLPQQKIKEEELKAFFKIEDNEEIPYRAEAATGLYLATDTALFAQKINEAIDQERDNIAENARKAEREKKASLSGRDS